MNITAPPKNGGVVGKKAVNGLNLEEKNPRMPFLREKTSKLTVSSGVYLMKDKDGSIIHTEQARVYTVKRDGIIAVSSEGYDDAEQKLDKPFYRLMLFLKTPLGTAAKIAAFIILAGGMYSALHYKDIKRFFKAKKALRRERIIERPYKDDEDNGGDNNG